MLLLLPSDIARARFHNHAGIDERGWALPPGVWATEYDEETDARSTHNMIQLLKEIFPDHPPRPVITPSSSSSSCCCCCCLLCCMSESPASSSQYAAETLSILN